MIDACRHAIVRRYEEMGGDRWACDICGMSFIAVKDPVMPDYDARSVSDSAKENFVARATRRKKTGN